MADDLLFISPVIPDITGNGLAMRAGSVLEALSHRYRVHLLVVPLYAPYGNHVPAPISSLCSGSAVLSTTTPPSATPMTVLRQLLGLRVERPLGMPFGDRRFSIIHAFRLVTLPYARLFAERNPSAERHLDLDDIESETRRAIAALYRLAGRDDEARNEDRQAEQALHMEREAFDFVDHLYVCSAADAAALGERTTKNVAVLPNVIRPRSVPVRAASDPFTFLFVGNLSYYPNEDAVSYLARDILPALRAAAPRPFRVTIVGRGPEEVFGRLRAVPEIEVVGWAADVAPHYRAADAVVVPVRAGGGTRIKVLEALAFGRPVVSTVVGTAGIALQDGRDVLIAADTATFARQCASLMSDANLAGRIAAGGAAVVSASYTIDALSRIVAGLASGSVRRSDLAAGSPNAPR